MGERAREFLRVIMRLVSVDTPCILEAMQLRTAGGIVVKQGL